MIPPRFSRRPRGAVLVFLFLFALGRADAGQQEAVGRVSWVHDGDTLQVDGIGKVRLIGVDVPETSDSRRDRYLHEQGVASATQRRVAREALRFAIAELKGQTVRLRFDGERNDRHGRVLAYVILPDGRNFNRVLIEAGLAVVYRRFDFKLKEDFLRVETEAREGGRGVWEPSS